MRSLVFLLTFLSFLTAFGQKITKDIYLKHAIRQDGLAVNFTVLDTDKKGVRRFSKDKFYYWYKSQLVLSTQGGASGTLLDGIFEAFYTNKQLAKKGAFFKGLKDGEWLYWRMDGTLIKTEIWKNGILNGAERLYNEEGKLYETILHNKKSFTRRTTDSLIVSNNTLTRQTIAVYDSIDRLRSKESYKNGKLEGRAKYYVNGKISDKKKYKKGVLVVKVAKEKKTEETKSGKTNPVEKKSKFLFFNSKRKQATTDGTAEKKEKKVSGKQKETTGKPTENKKKDRNPFKFLKKKKETSPS